MVLDVIKACWFSQYKCEQMFLWNIEELKLSGYTGFWTGSDILKGTTTYTAGWYLASDSNVSYGFGRDRSNSYSKTK